MANNQETIEFYSTNGKYGCFSNFSRHPVTINGIKWQTSEHYFQSRKFLDQKNQMDVYNATSPSIAAKIGRDRNRPLRSDWEKVKDDIMLEALRAKFTQNPDIGNILLQTGNSILVEDTRSSGDSYWGCGSNGNGKNMLGLLLMQLRDELRKTPFLNSIRFDN